MWTLDDQTLFGSGPCRVTRSPSALKHAVQAKAGGGGAALIAQGREALRVEQRGELVADDLMQLETMLNAIRARLDGDSRTLAADDGRRFDNLVMLSVDVTEPRRVGPRWSARFTVHYLEVKP